MDAAVFPSLGPPEGRVAPSPLEGTDEAREVIQGHIARLRPGLGQVKVTFHENSSTMVSKTEQDSRAVLRLHRIFRAAPPEILEALVRCFFSRLRRAETRAIRARLKDYVEAHRGDILRPMAGERVLSPAGETFDLREILGQIRTHHFPRADPVEIGWSRQLLRRLMGKWIENPEPLPNVVLINRLLDTPEVPRYYLDFLVFHEFLHEVIPARRSCGRWIHHSPEFRAREREFPEYGRALLWERKNLESLYRKSSPQKGVSRRW